MKLPDIFRKYAKYAVYIIISLAAVLIFFNSLTDLYIKRADIFHTLHGLVPHGHDEVGRYLVNPLRKSSRQLPTDKINQLDINNDADINGQWSAPFDWNVTAIHSVLLPDYSLMTFGTFGIVEKEDKDARANKEITLSDGRNLERDGGSYQWDHHDVNSGIDFDVWDYTKGFKSDTHQLFQKPIVMDAFCSVVRVLDLNRVFILGGNKNMDTEQPDTQNSTMIYNVKDRTFQKSEDLHHKRWYGSIVRTGNNELIMMGGEDVVTKEASTTPEILDLNKINDGWGLLSKADSNNLFGDEAAEEWNYPRAYLASDGNIVGLSYNKTWVMDKSSDYRISKTGEIPLVSSGISRTLEDQNKNEINPSPQLKLLTIGSPVGSTNSTVMVERDKVIVFGGKQEGAEYSPSNKVFSIDFSDSGNPIIEELESLSHARSNGNATILPNGEIFVNGGHAYNDLEFSNFTPEIYDPISQTSTDLSDAYFRRNYHSTSLLLSDGTIFTGGGDVWNAEIFYPPYLFTKNWNNKTVLAERPKILNLDKTLNRGEITINSSPGDISQVTLISTGSTTHAQGSENKFRNLKFSKQESTQLLIDIPKNKNDIQSGTYMLFLINDYGVPSLGEIVFID